MGRATNRDREASTAIAAGYEPLPGVPDELMAADGSIRPVWLPFIEHLSSASPESLTMNFARGDQYLRDAGVYFRHYGQKGALDRAWPLSHMPVILHEDEWQQIATGLTQRADLLENIVADLYGDNRLVADGVLPPEIVAGNPEWLRPMVGVKPASGNFLHFVAFDIGRGPSGQWWVLEDRVQAPSGSGFALENRVATARTFSEFYSDAHVHRLAGFFKGFREALTNMKDGDETGLAILSPGPMTDTYYEHAYIARYLGLTLLEGEDLTVENGRVMVRSVAGNRPLSVLWRRMDSSFADPLELDGSSRLGTAGLVETVRRGNVSIVNALGAGVLESRAMLAFLPRISEVLSGGPLAMPNVATWWCGNEGARAYVQANRERMVVSRAMPPSPTATRPDFGIDDKKFALSEMNGRHFVGQEQVTLSTTPTWEEGRLVARPLSLRVFLARTRDGWVTMPGGFARVGHSNDPKAVAMQSGGSVADVWVMADRKVATDTMVPTLTTPYVRPRQGALPSRAADNLFWLGRYVERAEGTMRLLRAYFARLSDAGEAENPLLALVRTYLEDLDIDPDEAVPQALRNMFSASIGSAGKVRDRFSVDGWLALNDLADSAERIAKTSKVGDDSARAMGVLLRKITGFSGLVHENMYRFTGWRFLSLGRSLERAIAMSSLLAVMTAEDAPEGALDFVVEVGDSTLSHRRRYTVRTSRPTVIDLLALDNMNPRSVAYQLNEIKSQIDLLPGAIQHGQLAPLSKAVLWLQTDIAIREPEDIDAEVLNTYGSEISALSDLITEVYLK